MTSYTVTKSNPVTVTLSDGSTQGIPAGCSWSMEDDGALVITDYYGTTYRKAMGEWSYLTEKVPGLIPA